MTLETILASELSQKVIALVSNMEKARPDEVLTVKEFAERARVSLPNVTKMVRQGLPTLMLPGGRRVAWGPAYSWMLEKYTE